VLYSLFGAAMSNSADLILEILNEEIPSRMQVQGAEAFKNVFTKKLSEQGLSFGHASCYITPRRITLHVTDIPVKQDDREEEKRGPRVGAPEQAIEGFLASVGIASLDECESRAGDKGEFWFAKVYVKGQETAGLIPKIIQEVVAGFTWPKSMRWGGNTLAWVRPIRSLMCLFDNQQVHGHLDLGSDLLPLRASTVGHRFMSRGELCPFNYESYRELLSDNYVLLDQNLRRARIAEEIAALAAEHGYRVRQDEGLLDEVTGLVEWPVPLMGKIDPAFMDLPEEVLITSMRVHQRYFALEDNTGRLVPNFILVSNVVPTDGGTALVHGNEKVLRARLSDAKFFYEQDQKTPLEEIGVGLSKAIFQDDLGSMADKVVRMVQLSEYLAGHAKLDPVLVKRATALSKSDLMSSMVGEFPELQGIMGGYYATLGKEAAGVAEAIVDQYKPKGFADDLPRTAMGRIVALCDKMDTLVGFFAIGIKPTGSKDPYALRRSAIGCIRLMQTMAGLPLEEIVTIAYQAYKPIFAVSKATASPLEEVIADLREFFFDRLKAYGREQGVRHDFLDAVFAVADRDAFDVITMRVDALNQFLNREDGMGDKLLSAYRRASNIVRIEEKKDQAVYDPVVQQAQLNEEAELRLYEALLASQQAIRHDIEAHDFQKAMAVLADLRPFIDEFFDKVTVNAEVQEIRQNRLRLLSLIRDTLHQVADFSKIEG
jgi:glycyl-tRNA synthetase beta chain